MYLPPWQWQALYGKSETDRQHPRRRTRHQLRRWSWSTLSWKHFAYPWRSLPTVSRPVNLLIWMSFMVTVLYVSPLTAEQLEIRSVTDAKHLGCPIISSAQSVQQSDGSSQLQVVEEIRRTFPPDITDFTFEGLVVEDLDVEVLAGTPFTERERECYLAMALSTHTGPRPHPVPSQPFAEPLYSVLLILPKTVWPWEFLEVQLPDDAPPDSEYALEPRTDAPTLRNLKPSQLGHNPVSFPVLCEEYAYQTCQPSI